MKIRRLQLHLVEARLRAPFRHAAHERRSSLNVVCGIESAEGLWGWGEGLPREYVTGETAESAYDAIAKSVNSTQWPEFETLEEMLAALERFSATCLPDSPSARCAVEVALIDLGARSLDLPARDVIAGLARRLSLPLRGGDDPVVHSGVIGEGSLASVAVKALKMRFYGLREIKVKVGSDPQADVARLRWLRRILGRHADIRVDANGAWQPDEARTMIERLARFGISSVEQPLARGAESHLPALRQATGVPIALDESLCTLEDARRAAAEGWCDLFNVRLSKCGGVVNALRILAEARRAGIGAWLGCMVGESGLLSAAGRAFALAVAGLRHVEGAYDRHLFDEFLADPVGFGRGGLGGPLPGPGLGVEINGEVLMRWTRQWDILPVR